MTGEELFGSTPADEQSSHVVSGQEQLPPATTLSEVSPKVDGDPQVQKIGSDEVRRIGDMFYRFVDSERRGPETPVQGR